MPILATIRTHFGFRCLEKTLGTPQSFIGFARHTGFGTVAEPDNASSERPLFGSFNALAASER